MKGKKKKALSGSPYRQRHIRPYNLGSRIRLRVADRHQSEIIHTILAQGLDRLRVDEEAPELDAAGALKLGLRLTCSEKGRVAKLESRAAIRKKKMQGNQSE